MGPFEILMTLNISFLPHSRGCLEVRNRRQPVDRTAVMLSAIQCWLRQIQTGIYLKRISLIYGTIAWFPLITISELNYQKHNIDMRLKYLNGFGLAGSA